jgi:uncharacterized protein (DUF697 family)
MTGIVEDTLTESQLDGLVSVAIRRAEELDDLGEPSQDAWREVMTYEERLADLTSPSKIAGGIARAGAVRAALAAGMRGHAERLATKYLAEESLPAERRTAIERAFREAAAEDRTAAGDLTKTAAQLVRALNHPTDENLPRHLAEIVERHAGIAAGQAFIPIPGADMTGSAANIRAMYVRINEELKLPFGENIVNRVASRVVTNLAAGIAGLLAMGSALNILPGFGTLAGAAFMGTTYAITVASGIVYMKALTALARRTSSVEDVSEEDLKTATDDVMRDKKLVQSMIKGNKREHPNKE